MEKAGLEAELVALLERVRDIKISPEYASAAANRSCLYALDSLIQTLTTQRRDREADAIRIARDQCLESKVHSGLELDLETMNVSGGNDDIHKTLLFEIEVWLEALNSEDRARNPRPSITSKPAGRRSMTLSEKILAHHAVTALPMEGPTVDDTVRVCVDWIISSELAWEVSNTLQSFFGDEPHRH